MKKVLFSLIAIALVLALSASVVVAGSSSNLVTNGDFEAGTLSGWTPFTTINGTANNGTSPVVELFDTNGDSSANLSAKFNVGQIIYVSGVWEGGGIYQMVSAPAGSWTASADIAVIAEPTGNLQGGLFELLIDSVVKDSFNVSLMYQDTTNRSTLSASGTFLTAGNHELRIRITRPHLAVSGTPKQYVDNVVLEVTPTSIDVDIDIKPGSFPNSLNVKSKGVLPVAILGTADFDVMTVNASTVVLTWRGISLPAGEGVPPLRWALEDVNRDGFMDIGLKYSMEAAGTVTLTDEASGPLTMMFMGNLMDGTRMSGEDTVRIINKRYVGP